MFEHANIFRFGGKLSKLVILFFTHIKVFKFFGNTSNNVISLFVQSIFFTDFGIFFSPVIVQYLHSNSSNLSNPNKSNSPNTLVWFIFMLK